METGKTGKYFKYAIREIVLVVLGILIAWFYSTYKNPYEFSIWFVFTNLVPYTYN